MRSLKLAYVLSFMAGYALMAVEMTAIRALAPSFGTSAFVWAVVISTVMCLMFVGSLVGGRAADRGSGIEKVCDVQVGASVAIMVTSQSVLLFLPEYVPSLSGPAWAIAAVMVGSTLLVSFPILLLASASPWLIGILVRQAGQAGGISGRIYAAGTLGGLFGTFLPVLVLVPTVGSRWTFASVALALAVVAVVVRWAVTGSFGRSLARFVVIALFLGLASIPTTEDPQVIDRSESVYNSITVKDDGVRIDLEVNEGRVIQSRSYHDPDRLPVDVWSLYLTADFFSTPKPNKRVLFLGVGAGSAAVYYHRYFPGYSLVGVEIDPEIIAMGKAYFGLGDFPIRIENTDARRFLQGTSDRFDIIIADAFAFPYLPAHLSTVEFMGLVRSRLAEGGVALFNVGRYQDHREVVDSIVTTGLQSFAYAYAYDLDNDMNTLVFLSERQFNGKLHAEMGDRRLVKLGRRVARSLRAASPTQGMISTDDRPLSEWLTHQVVLEAFGLL